MTGPSIPSLKVRGLPIQSASLAQKPFPLLELASPLSVKDAQSCLSFLEQTWMHPNCSSRPLCLSHLSPSATLATPTISINAHWPGAMAAAPKGHSTAHCSWRLNLTFLPPIPDLRKCA